MNPLISVIVPVYNVEDYLDRCVHSITRQTYKNLEIILVDDGSTDSSGEKCDVWTKKDNRIRVIHKENGGLSDARNAGLDIVSGEYIGFVDSDDYLNKNMYQFLFDCIQKTNSDIAECKWIKFEDEKEINVFTTETESEYKVFSPEDALIELIVERDLKQTVVNKLYKRSVISVLFPTERINEDEFWTYQIFGNARKIAFVDIELYYYFQRNSSIMHIKYSPKRLDGVEARKERMFYIEQKYPSIYNNACLSYLWSCFYHFQVICRNNDIDVDYQHRNTLYNEYNKYYCKDAINVKPLKQRVWMKLFKLFPNFTCKIRNALKIGL